MKISSDRDSYIGGRFTKSDEMTPKHYVNNERKISKTISVDIELTRNDILNWIMACDDPAILKHLGKAASNRARAIENPDY